MSKKEKPRRIMIEPHPVQQKAKKGEKIKAISLDFQVRDERPNVYELEDGTVVMVRLNASHIKRALDYETEEPVYKKSGEPLYGIDFDVSISWDFPEHLKRPKKGDE